VSRIEHRSFDVRAMGSTDAKDQAKDAARAQGLKVRTLVRVDQLERHVRDNRREVLSWRVTLAVVVPS
jgi:hypothetical protein